MGRRTTSCGSFGRRRTIRKADQVGRQRRTDLADELFEVLRWLFSVVHPAWSIPVAGVFFLIPVLWFHYNIKFPQFQALGFMLGIVLAIISLAAGVAGWQFRQQRAAFLQEHLDIAWLNNLTWQDFERQVSEVYRQRGYSRSRVGCWIGWKSGHLFGEKDIVVKCKPPPPLSALASWNC